MTQQLNWHPVENASKLATQAAAMILSAAKKAISERGCFKLVLAGGNTPAQAYRLLIDAETDWNQWHIYYGDERCLAADNKDRNSVMAVEYFLKHTAIPVEQIHTMPTELGNEKAAELYRPIVEAALPFDMVLLGMGEDGHTASLFPNQTHQQDELVHAVYNSPKAPPERISLSAAALSDAQQVIFLISAGKDDALKAWKSGEDLPIASIQPKTAVDVLLATA